MKRTTPLSLGTRRSAGAAVLAMLLLVLAMFATTPQIARAAQGDIVRGTVTAELALYEAADSSLEPVDYLPAGFTFQALDMGDGWFGAQFNGVDRFFSDSACLAFYTAPDTTVYHGAVVGGELGVLYVPAEQSAVAATFACGATIQFCQFDDTYYMARLGDGTVCYIPVARVRLYSPLESGTLVRWAGEAGARVYAAPDESSSLLLTFESGRQLWFADFDSAWLMATMTVDGAARTVFVPKADVLVEQPVEPQPPVVDPNLPEEGGEDSGSSDDGGTAAPADTVWVITAYSVSGRSAPLWDSSALVTFRKGAVLTALPTGDGWYAVVYNDQTMYLPGDAVNVIPSSSYSVYQQYYDVTLAEAVAYQNVGSWIVSRGGSWQAATAEDLYMYMDPNNFPEGTSGFFQFLVLTQPLGVSVQTLNLQLSGKGILEGQGQAFHDAAYAYGINEAYLISHALHETGNGWSSLAQGVWYDPETETAYYEEQEGTTLVYNMYGIGAVDSNPLNGGARYAYQHGWFTPYDAVYGGASFIGRTYLYSDAHTGYGYASTLSGQNTLYKMLYHPEWVARYHEKPWHQYATDVAWANAQTYYYTRLLADYDYYTLTFEVPTYASN